MPPCNTEVMEAWFNPAAQASSKLNTVPPRRASQIASAIRPSGSAARSTEAMEDSSSAGISAQKTSRSIPAHTAPSRRRKRRNRAPRASRPKGGTKTSR